MIIICYGGREELFHFRVVSRAYFLLITFAIFSAYSRLDLPKDFFVFSCFIFKRAAMLCGYAVKFLNASNFWFDERSLSQPALNCYVIIHRRKRQMFIVAIIIKNLYSWWVSGKMFPNFSMLSPVLIKQTKK